MEQNRKKDEELKKLKEAAAGKTPAEDADGDANMQPQDGPNEKEKRAFIKARISIFEARAKMSKQMAPEHRIEEDDVNTQKKTRLL